MDFLEELLDILDEYPDDADGPFTIAVAKSRKEESLQWCIKNEFHFTKEAAMCAMKYCHLNAVKHCIEHEYDYHGLNIIDIWRVMSYVDLSIVQYLVGFIEVDGDLLACAADNKNHDVFEWLYDNYPDAFPSNDYPDALAETDTDLFKCGNIKMIKRLINDGYKLTERAMEDAVLNDDLDICKQAYELGAPLGLHFSCAIMGDNRELWEWFYSVKAPVNDCYACAARMHNTKSLQWLMDHKVPIIGENMLYYETLPRVRDNSNDDINRTLKWLRKNKFAKQPGEENEIVSKLSLKAIISYDETIGFEKTESLFKTAIDRKNVPIYKYIVESVFYQILDYEEILFGINIDQALNIMKQR